MENSEDRGVRGQNLWCPPRGCGQWPAGPGCAPRSPVVLSKEAALAVSTCWAPAVSLVLFSLQNSGTHGRCP